MLGNRRDSTSAWNTLSGYETKECVQVSVELKSGNPESAGWGMAACGRQNKAFMDEDIDRLICTVLQAEINGCWYACLRCDKWK